MLRRTNAYIFYPDHYLCPGGDGRVVWSNGTEALPGGRECALTLKQQKIHGPDKQSENLGNPWFYRKKGQESRSFPGYRFIPDS